MNLRRELRVRTLASALIVVLLLLGLFLVWTIHDTRSEIEDNHRLIQGTIDAVRLAQSNPTDANQGAASQREFRHSRIAVLPTGSLPPQTQGGMMSLLPGNLELPLPGADGQPGPWTLRASALAHNELQEHLRSALLALVALLALGAVIIGLQYRSLMTAFGPVGDMQRQLAAFEAGALDTRIVIPELEELAAIAKSFNRLADSLQRTLREQQELSLALADLRSGERTLMAREIHDELGQSVTGLGVHLSILRQTLTCEAPDLGTRARPELESLEQDVDRIRHTIRKLLARLRSSGEPALAFEPISARAGIDYWQTRYPATRVSLPVEFDVWLSSMPPQHQAVVARIIQEALTNAFRHGSPSAIQINLDAQPSSDTRPGAYRLSITNDGAYESAPAAPGFGIAGMTERALTIGASLSAANGTHAGEFTVVLVYPGT